MRLSILVFTVAATGVLAWAGSAQSDDASDAVDELRQGYALKKDGNCRDALPHFARSVALDPKPKALLNRADCEAQMGDLVAAQGHAAQGLQLARQANDSDLMGVAEAQLAAVETKLPHLTIKLRAGAPAGSTVSRDGAAVDGALIGVATAVNPGEHKVVVGAPGFSDRTFNVTLTEGANEAIVVQPGARLATASRPEPMETPTATGVDTQPPPETWPRRPLLYTALAVGGAGLVLGVTAGLVASGDHSTLQGECGSGSTCDPKYSGDLDAFHTWRTISTIGYVVGALGVVGGGVLWFMAPQPSHSSARLWFGPASAGLAGAF
jgi:hypothetical protein